MGEDNPLGIIAVIGFVAFLLIGVIIAGCVTVPQYNVWQQGKSGEAQLAKAEQNRMIAVEEAQAKLESSKYEAQAEVERAKGVAEANAIIGESLKNNESYLRYLWINGLHDGSSEVIYIPTEANLPILEATRGLRPVREELLEAATQD